VAAAVSALALVPLALTRPVDRPVVAADV